MAELILWKVYMVPKAGGMRKYVGVGFSSEEKATEAANALRIAWPDYYVLVDCPQ